MRDLLIALCGLTPQVVTETLWALGRQQPAIVPKEVWILTTESGKKICERRLFGKTGQLTSYLREHARGRAVRYGPRNVITLKHFNSRPLEDLRTQDDNLAVADHFAEIMREFTARPNMRLHCSVAGGRKTMGVLLASVLQLYGRPDDRLYHVLVSPEFESHPDFFYIPKRPRLIATSDGKTLDTRKARIELAEIPYVRLRAYLPEELLNQSLPFTELVASAQKNLRALERAEPVMLGSSGRPLFIGETTVKLSPAQAQLYTAFARIKKENCVEPERKDCRGCIACYRAVSKGNWDSVREELEALAGDSFLTAGIGYFRTLLSKIAKKLASTLKSGDLAARYEIKSERLSGETCYGLAVDKTLIRFES